MKIKAVVFDWDLTLVDSAKAKIELYKILCDRYNVPFPSMEEIKKLAGVNEGEVTKYFHSKTIMEEYKKEYKKKSPIVKFLGGDVLKGLRERKTKVGIYSNEVRDNIDFICNRERIKFDVLVTYEDCIKPKPDPEGLLKVMEKLGVKKDETVYVGDHPFDIETGKNAGVKTIAVVSPLHTKEELQRHRPDYVIERLEEILEMIE